MKQKLIVDGFGTKRWYLGDMLHREDGPAIIYKHSLYIYSGGKSYWLNHRGYPQKEWFFKVLFSKLKNGKLL